MMLTLLMLSPNWIEDAIVDAHKCLCAKKIPKSDEGCEWCAYYNLIKEYE